MILIVFQNVLLIILTLLEFAIVIVALIIVCNEKCSECNGIGSFNCLSCNGGKILLNHQCVDECPFGSYLDSEVCLPCVSPCASCNSETECTSCLEPFYNIEGSCVYELSCPQKTYKNEITLKCENCSIACSDCYGPNANQSLLSSSNGKLRLMKLQTAAALL